MPRNDATAESVETTRPTLTSVPAASTDEDDEAVQPPITAMPRLGRGIVWADILAEMERDNLRREAA